MSLLRSGRWLVSFSKVMALFGQGDLELGISRQNLRSKPELKEISNLHPWTRS